MESMDLLDRFVMVRRAPWAVNRLGTAVVVVMVMVVMVTVAAGEQDFTPETPKDGYTTCSVHTNTTTSSTFVRCNLARNVKENHEGFGFASYTSTDAQNGLSLSPDSLAVTCYWVSGGITPVCRSQPGYSLLNPTDLTNVVEFGVPFQTTNNSRYICGGYLDVTTQAKLQSCCTHESDEYILGLWTEWGGPCSVSCGGGTRVRTRSCYRKSSDSLWECVYCTGLDKEQLPSSCNEQPCPVDGSWGEWGDFDNCSATCGGGSQQRRRSCDSPAPAHDGADCPGNASLTQTCNPQPCHTVPGQKPWLYIVLGILAVLVVVIAVVLVVFFKLKGRHKSKEDKRPFCDVDLRSRPLPLPVVVRNRDSILTETDVYAVIEDDASTISNCPMDVIFNEDADGYFEPCLLPEDDGYSLPSQTLKVSGESEATLSATQKDEQATKKATPKDDGYLHAFDGYLHPYDNATEKDEVHPIEQATQKNTPKDDGYLHAFDGYLHPIEKATQKDEEEDLGQYIKATLLLVPEDDKCSDNVE